METKTKFCKLFKKEPFNIYGDIPMDEELIPLMEKINRSPNIVTLNSCTGHDRFEKSVDQDWIAHPYFAFSVNEPGWEIFWNDILPEITNGIHIEVIVSTDPEKFCIGLYCKYDSRNKFWGRIEINFLKYFK